MTLQTDYVMMTITTTMMAKTTNDDCGKDDEVDEQWHEIDEKTVVRSEIRLRPLFCTSKYEHLTLCSKERRQSNGLLRDINFCSLRTRISYSNMVAIHIHNTKTLINLLFFDKVNDNEKSPWETEIYNNLKCNRLDYDKVKIVIAGLKSSTAAGDDGLPGELFKCGQWRPSNIFLVSSILFPVWTWARLSDMNYVIIEIVVSCTRCSTSHKDLLFRLCHLSFRSSKEQQKCILSHSVLRKRT